MANSTWLWIDEAARRIAQRLGETGSHCSEPQYALDQAREQLLDEAFRGSIEVEGKAVGLPEQEPQFEPQFEPREWEVVNSEYWDPNHRRRRQDSDLFVEISWRDNAFWYDVGIPVGFESLRVKAVDVDRIWPQEISKSQWEPPSNLRL
jgi:hypothetical protein